MPNEQLREENMREVLEQALQLIAEYGVDNVSLPQIAQRAHVSVRSVYRYYGTKAQLVQAVVQLSINSIQQAVIDTIESDGYKALPGAERVLALVRAMLENVRSKSGQQINLTEIEAYFIRSNVPDVFSLYDERENLIVRYFRTAFGEGVADGSITPQVVKNGEYFITLAVTFRGFYNRLAVICSNPEMSAHYDPDRLIDEFVSMIRKSISDR